MTLRTRLFVWLAALMALALVTAACGDGPAETDEPTTTTTIAAIDDTTTTTEAPAETTTTLATLEATSTTTATETAPSSEAAARVTEAINKSSELPSARYEGEIRMTGIVDPTQTLPTDEFTMGFSGAYDADGDFSMAMDLSSIAELAGEELGGFGDLFGAMEIRVIDDVGYLSMPLFTMFTGFEWVEFPEDESAEVTGGFTAGANPGNPSDFLDAMRDLDAEVREIGRELVRGEETTHYSARIDVEALLEDATPEERAELEGQIGASGISELPFDVWIGDDGILRRYEFVVDGSELEPEVDGQEFERMTMVMEIFDVGADITIEPPPADQIAPEDALLDIFGFADAFGDLDG